MFFYTCSFFRLPINTVWMNWAFLRGVMFLVSCCLPPDRLFCKIWWVLEQLCRALRYPWQERITDVLGTRNRAKENIVNIQLTRVSFTNERYGWTSPVRDCWWIVISAQNNLLSTISHLYLIWHKSLSQYRVIGDFDIGSCIPSALLSTWQWR